MKRPIATPLPMGRIPSGPNPATHESGATPRQSGRRTMATGRMRAKDWAPYLFISPFFILFAAFGLFPLLFSIYLSFQQWDPANSLATIRHVGLENYYFVLTDPWFWNSVRNTVWIALAAGVPQHVLAIGLAFFIDTYLKRLKNPVLGMYFLPYITSSVAIALIFSTLFSRDFGIINALIGYLGAVPGLTWILPARAVDWLGNYSLIKLAVSFVLFWRYLGWNVVLYLAALQAIPADLYEATRMDGATTWQQFRYVTLPLLKPMMYFAVSLTVIGNLQVFEEPFILVGPAGGPAQAALTTAMYMYRTAFNFNDFGTASAMSWLLFMLIGLAMLLSRRLLGNADAERSQ